MRKNFCETHQGNHQDFLCILLGSMVYSFTYVLISQAQKSKDGSN